MTDSIEKFLRKLTAKQRRKVQEMKEKILLGDFLNLDIKVLRGHPDIARVRLGEYRFIFRGIKIKDIRLIKITKRDENTYKN